MFSIIKRPLAFAFCLFAVVVLSSCQSENRTEKKIQQDTAVSDIEGSLVFNNVTLDQVDEQGRPVWKVRAKRVVYTKDKKLARIENPTGDLFQDGKIVLQVTAKSGEVQEDGKKIFLNDQITATDTRNGAILKGDQLEWYPQQDLLIVRNNLQGSHPQLQSSAKEGKYFTRKQQAEFFGQVTALAKDPDLQMKTEHLIWQIKEQKVSTDKRTQMERYKGKTVTDRVESDLSEVNLKTKVVTLKQNIQLTSIDPPLLMSSNAAVWNTKTQIVVSDKPVRIVHLKENVIITANQGQVDLERRIANLRGGVEGVGSRNQAKLYSNQLTWDIPTQNVQASGNVIYKQVDPPLTTTGPTAFGRLQDQSIVVTGEAGSQVVTEIIP
ncbi:MAG TPA: LPS export ABC transporter periplasmic protein LptC [Coleofasciculaceae cyanobacterium]